MKQLLSQLVNIGVASNLTKSEKKLVKLLNYITITLVIILALKIILFFSPYRSPGDSLLVCYAYFAQFFSLIFVFVFQYKERYTVARLLFFIITSFQTFIFCNYLDKGNLVELFYIVMPLLSILFLKNKGYHYFFLLLALFCCSVVPEWYGLYPTRTESVFTIPTLYVVVFFMFSYFKNENTKNEHALEDERKQIEKDKNKIEQQSNELKQLNEFQTHFFINITHELRTPLTLIKGNVFGAKKAKSLNETQEKLDRILTNSTKIENLINDIIDVSKAETNTLTLNWELYGINQIIQKQYLAFKPLFEEKEIDFEYHVPEKNIYVDLDKLYFERVIGNVLVNAIKYTPKGGNVKISITETNNELSINIKDNGIGIALGEEEKIFNRFYQVNNDINSANGSGIGLAFCKEVVQLLKGNIKASQNNDKGTTFSITLPKAVKNNDVEIPLTNIVIDLQKPTVLLVDDNVEMREYLSSVLTEYNIIEANNGVEALEVLKDNKIDALVTDYMMPKMNGYELIEHVKEKQYSFPILVITARADVKSKLNILALGIDDYLTKPFIEEELVYRLQNSLANAKSRTTFQQEALFTKDEIDVEDNKLIQKSKNIVEQNIGNLNFGVPDMVEALNITERTLYRKIKANSGLTPNQFIREIKLLHVRALVEQNKTVSLNQLTEKVGLKNSSHLQKLYKERFGTELLV